MDQEIILLVRRWHLDSCCIHFWTSVCVFAEMQPPLRVRPRAAHAALCFVFISLFSFSCFFSTQTCLLSLSLISCSFPTNQSFLFLITIPFSPKVTIWFLQTPLKKFSPLFFYVFVFFLCLTVYSTFINTSRLPAHLFFCAVVPQYHLVMWLEVCSPYIRDSNSSCHLPGKKLGWLQMLPSEAG